MAAHALVGGLTGGAAGAAGAGTAAFSANAIEQLTDGLPGPVRQLVGAGIAAGIGAIAGGTTGAATAFNADVNNRQLHPTEARWIRDNASRYARQRGITEEEAQRQLAAQAYRQVQFGAEGEWDASAQRFLSDAKGMLPSEGTHGPGYMFQATPAQKAALQMYVDTLPQLADFYIGNGLKLPEASAVAGALALDTQQRELYANLTVGAGAAAGVLVLAGVSPALATWVLTHPDKAVQTGLISAETAAAIASGAVTPTSMTEALGQNLGRSLTAAERAAVDEMVDGVRAAGTRSGQGRGSGSAAVGEASSQASSVRLRGQLVGEEIAGGHAFVKHVVLGHEFDDLGIRTREQFADHIEKVLLNPSASRQLSGGRSAYWDDLSGTVVIRNPRAPDGGTAFRPANGRAYFDSLR